VSESASYDYPAYLRAKREIDDRSLNCRVWRQFVGQLNDCGPDVDVIEVGAGVGATAERVVEAVIQSSLRRVGYTLVDINADNLVVAQNRLRRWLREQGFDVRDREGGPIQARGPATVEIQFVTGDLLAPEALDDQRPCDAVISQAVLDLLPVPAALATLRSVLKEGGLWYLPIHFDGITAFEPPLPLDEKVERLYHDSMSGETRGSAGAHTGRRLLTRLREVGATLLDVGSSDWVVFGGKEGYSERETVFLHHILGFIERELTDHRELDATAFDQWIARRRQHIEEGTLIYVAHQLDVLARQDDELGRGYPSKSGASST